MKYNAPNSETGESGATNATPALSDNAVKERDGMCVDSTHSPTSDNTPQRSQRCPYSGCHPPDVRRYYRVTDPDTGEDYPAEDTICPGCGKWVRVIIYDRWPDGLFPRIGLHVADAVQP